MLSSRQLYELLNSLSRHQIEELISRLRSRGIRIRSIRPYAYPEVPQAFHVFILFDGSNEELDYFQLEPDVLQQIILGIEELSEKEMTELHEYERNNNASCRNQQHLPFLDY